MAGSMSPPGRSRLESLWQSDLAFHERVAWAALTPMAAAYRIVLGMRGLYWRTMKRRARPIVVSVGNLTIGGNAKTPFTLFVASRLRMRGLKVAIVSRGWGRKATSARATLVSDGERILAGPDEAGDEAAMMAKSFAGPIAVARRRIHGIALLEQKFGEFDAVVLDDGFQHVRLARDVDLLLMNAERGVGNGWLLPAGPMREPIGAVRRANAVILIEPAPGGPSAPLPREITNHRCVMRAELRPRALVEGGQAGWIETSPTLTGRRVVAVSGLANPSGFYRMLRGLDVDLVGVLEYPDHHAYTSRDWQSIVAATRDGAVLVTTEKDLVKLERFPFQRESLYALRLEVAMDLDDEARLLAMIIGENGRPRAAAGANS